jgi:hypothetical protein
LQKGAFICSLYDCLKFLSPFYAGLVRFTHLRGKMNKLDVSSPAFTLSSTSRPETSIRSGQGGRLIVLFPASAIDTPSLSHRIWEIARSLQLNVLILSLSNDFDKEPQLRRQLIGLASIIKDPYISTEIMIEHGNDWVGQVSKVWQAGDVLACYAGQKVGLMRKPLDQILKSSMNAPVYFLSDYQPIQDPNSTFISQVIAWAGSLAILGGFLWGEVKIVQLSQDWAHTALLYISIVVEVALMWAWNSICG